ncbi:Cytochrome p450 [Colletotrichum higginsianum IMI 349063]|nr:Cytochrome p450 [Colletotrichum higginsianum IMI 349063]OBR16242.1 Cytochrome p450 [Colletotrichum higginsianum IMI 349063]
MFSRTGILKLEPLMHEKLSLLDSKIEKLCHIKEIDIYNAFRLLTSEVIMQFSFAKSAEMINEHDDNFNSRFTDALTAAVHSVSYAYENPLVGYIGKCLPAWILRIMSPEMSKVLDLVEV